MHISLLFIRHLYCNILWYCDIYLCNIVIFCDILYCDILTYDEGEALQGSNRHLGFTKWICRGDNCKIMKSILWVKVIQMLQIAKIWFFLVYFMIWKNKNAIRGKYLEAIGQTAPPLATEVFRTLDKVTHWQMLWQYANLCLKSNTDCDVMAIVAVVVVVAVADLEFQCRIE